jgi:hypothetical protein
LPAFVKLETILPQLLGETWVQPVFDFRDSHGRYASLTANDRVERTELIFETSQHVVTIDCPAVVGDSINIWCSRGASYGVTALHLDALRAAGTRALRVGESVRIRQRCRVVAHIGVQVDATAEGSQRIERQEAAGRRIIIAIAQIDEAGVRIDLRAGEAEAAEGDGAALGYADLPLSSSSHIAATGLDNRALQCHKYLES